MAFRIKISSQALRDLKSIGNFVAADDPIAAGDFDEKLLARAQSLTTLPNRHGVWIKEPNIRKMPLGNYVIYYKIYDTEQIVEILRFWHAARDRRKLRLKEEAKIAYGEPTPAAN